MRQLVAAGALSSLASDLHIETNLKIIELWPCLGVLIVAPEERVEFDDDEDPNEGALERMVSPTCMAREQGYNIGGRDLRHSTCK